MGRGGSTKPPGVSLVEHAPCAMGPAVVWRGRGCSLVGESGLAAPLLPTACTPLPALTGLTFLDRCGEQQHRAQELWITKCHTSVLHSIFRHFGGE